VVRWQFKTLDDRLTVAEFESQRSNSNCVVNEQSFPVSSSQFTPGFHKVYASYYDGNSDVYIPNDLLHTTDNALIVRLAVKFNDVPETSFYYPYIMTIGGRRVTVGCGVGIYCPNGPSGQVSREQMAAFIMRSLGVFNPPPPTQQRFQDVPPSNSFYAFIEELAARQITAGCSASPPLYCPTGLVTRGQIATFLERAQGNFNPPAPTQQRFGDVPPSQPFYAFIESFVQRGLSRGILDVTSRNCSAGNFCPDQPITRDEMAAFLAIAFGW
jgi:hypothetical protein